MQYNRNLPAVAAEKSGEAAVTPESKDSLKAKDIPEIKSRKTGYRLSILECRALLIISADVVKLNRHAILRG